MTIKTINSHCTVVYTRVPSGVGMSKAMWDKMPVVDCNF